MVIGVRAVVSSKDICVSGFQIIVRLFDLNEVFLETVKNIHPYVTITVVRCVLKPIHCHINRYRQIGILRSCFLTRLIGTLRSAITGQCKSCELQERSWWVEVHYGHSYQVDSL